MRALLALQDEENAPDEMFTNCGRKAHFVEILPAKMPLRVCRPPIGEQAGTRALALLELVK
jgi:hypothetical protein